MAIKRKAASTIVKDRKAQSSKVIAQADGEEEVDVEVDLEVAKKAGVTKVDKKAAKAESGKKVVSVSESPSTDVDGGKAANEEDARAAREEEEVAARGKALKAMAVEDLKELVEKLGLDRGKKADMVEAVLAHEAKALQEQREREANFRRVVVDKKQELTALPINELKERCRAAAIDGQMTREERIERLLTQWQAGGGIDRALAKIASDKREAGLLAMGAAELQTICHEAGVDTLVKEVMVDRILRREVELGKFAPPTPAEQEAKAYEPAEIQGDLVATLLAKEAARAKKQAEEEKQQQRNALAAKKKEELRATTNAELKRRLANRGAGMSGTKEELIETLFELEMKEEAVAAKKADLKALGKDGLKELLGSMGLQAIGGLDAMVEAVLQDEARCEAERRAYDDKIMEQLKVKKAALDAKTGAELRELCAAKGMSAGVSNEDRVQRLLRVAKEDGEIDRAIAHAARVARREVLDAMDKGALRKLCGEIDVNPFVQSVMIERLLHFEAEAGNFAARTDGPEPPTKKQRTGKQ